MSKRQATSVKDLQDAISIGRGSEPTGKASENAIRKMPRERIISAKLPKEHEKLPPPPYGRTMGHGFLASIENNHAA